jgi:hypothetical protein
MSVRGGLQGFLRSLCFFRAVVVANSLPHVLQEEGAILTQSYKKSFAINFRTFYPTSGVQTRLFWRCSLEADLPGGIKNTLMITPAE